MPVSLVFRKAVFAFAVTVGALSSSAASADTVFQRPWAAQHRALVIDAYEYNQIDLPKIASNKRIGAFIHKGSDGLPPAYGCKTAKDETERALCKKDWKVYSVGRELYHTRRALAKALGMKWGVYHLGRPGNPIDQANHLIDFAEPSPDELIAIDIEDIASDFISLSDAEEFSRHIKRRLDRYPVLYVNGSTAKHIAENRDKYPLLSRLPLWYARYKPAIGEHFPKGNWDNYALWQFASQVNCGKRSCPYRIDGAGNDIDVNVADMNVEDLKKAWPFNRLIAVKDPKSSKDFSRMLIALLKKIAPEANSARHIVEAGMGKLTIATAAFQPAPHINEIPPIGVDRITTASIALNVDERQHD